MKNKLLSSIDIVGLREVAKNLFVRIPIVINKLESQIDAENLAIEIQESGDFTHIFNTARDKNQQKHLGCEYGSCIIIIDRHAPINLLCAILGTVKGGSLVVLINIGADIEKNFLTDYFLRDLKVVQKYYVDTVGKHLNANAVNISNESVVGQIDINYKAISKNKNITHIIGQRGRGKTTLLGKIARELIKNNGSIVCTAPSKRSAFNLMSQNENVSRETFLFLPPEKLLSRLTEFSHVIIDEAASLPFELIQRSISVSKELGIPLFLATTLEGYESKGQSYRLGYLEENNMKKNTKVIELLKPFRFSINDKIERVTSSLCFQNISSNILFQHDDGIFHYSNVEIVEKGLLLSCYKLLAQAHYKTSPNDLAEFYNNSALIFSIVIEKNAIISACVSTYEDCQDKSLAKDIYFGIRRPQGAMSIQSLISSYGALDIINHSYIRIVRIATKSGFRRMGHATRLVNAVYNLAKEKNRQALTVSFSAQQINISFWESQGFVAVRVGFTPNKYNGCLPILMLRKTIDLNIFSKINFEFLMFWKFYNSKDKVAKYLNIKQPLFQFDLKNIPEEIEYSQLANHITPKEIKNNIESITEGRRDVRWFLPILSYSNLIDNEEISKVTANLDSIKTKG